MGKPGPEDIVEEPLAKEESKSEGSKEEVAVAENEKEAFKVDSGVAIEIGDEMKESETKEDASIGKST